MSVGRVSVGHRGVPGSPRHRRVRPKPRVYVRTIQIALLTRGVFCRLRDRAAFVVVSVDEMGGRVWESGPHLSRDPIYLAGDPA